MLKTMQGIGMSPAPARILLVIVLAFEVLAQATDHRPSADRAASPAWPFGPPHSVVCFEGLLARSDGETLSVELHDERVIRFRLDNQTQYKPNGPPESLAGFRMADVVLVESEVDTNGYLTAHNVRFVRSARADEEAEIRQCPEFRYRWRANLVGSIRIDPARDDRKLSLVAKPDGVPDDSAPLSGDASRHVPPEDKDLLGLIRQNVNGALDRLPNFRAKQVTSLFSSNSTPFKWIPDGVVTAEVGYAEGRESYSDFRIDGKRPAFEDLYQHMFSSDSDKAWSTGDFSDISHCVFAGLKDSDFRSIRTEHGKQGDLVVYEFTGLRAMTCIGVRLKSQVAYPAYQGLLKVSAQTQEVLHVELEAKDIPSAFPIDRAERSVDFDMVRIGGEQYLLPIRAYWYGCYRDSYLCFLNRIEFRDYHRFKTDSAVRF
jgi:hypothetical protein